MPTVILRKGKDGEIKEGKLWIYHRDVEKVSPNTTDGSIVKIKDHKERFLCIGYCNKKSKIPIRILSFKKINIDKNFFVNRIKKAISYRDQFSDDSNALRILFSEGDLLPGLIIDKYNQTIIIQILTLGMEILKETIIEAINESLTPKTIIVRNDINVRTLEGLSLYTETVKGEVERFQICKINSLPFLIDLQEGHKTGFYLDQKLNYKILQPFAKSARVLDCFCYTGGFGIHAGVAGAKEVIGIDISPKVLEVAKENAKLNNIENVCTWIEGNTFDYLRNLSKNKKELFDIIIIDPPSFLKNRQAIDSAKRGYKELLIRALKLIKNGGIILICSCSYHINWNCLKEILISALKDVKKKAWLLSRITQSYDHPTLISHPETEYLKGFLLQIR